MNKHHHHLILQTPLVNWFLFSNLDQSQWLREWDTERHFKKFYKVVKRFYPDFESRAIIKENGRIDISINTNKHDFPVTINLEPDTHLLYLAPDEFVQLSTAQLQKLFPCYNKKYYLSLIGIPGDEFVNANLQMFDRLYKQAISNIEQNYPSPSLSYEYIKDKEEVFNIHKSITGCVNSMYINPYVHIFCEYYLERDLSTPHDYHQRQQNFAEALESSYDRDPRLLIYFCKSDNTTQEYTISPGDVIIFRNDEFYINSKIV